MQSWLAAAATSMRLMLIWQFAIRRALDRASRQRRRTREGSSATEHERASKDPSLRQIPVYRTGLQVARGEYGANSASGPTVPLVGAAAFGENLTQDQGYGACVPLRQSSQPRPRTCRPNS